MKNVFVSQFTPSLMTRETLEYIFVQREDLLSRLQELIQDSATSESRHNTLLVGPRGIGKTHLVSMLYHRVRQDAKLDSQLYVAWLREEEWGIDSFADLLLRILRAIVSEYPTLLSEDRFDNLFDLPTTAIEHAAGELLAEITQGHTLLLLLENMDDLFNGLGLEGQKRFRAYLQNRRSISVVATTQSLWSGVSKQSAPFFGFFRIEHLHELNFDEATSLLKRLAELKNDTELVEYLETPQGRARVRAVHHLAGGHPRIYVIFSQFLTRESLDELVEPFMSLLDSLTPYYQARMSYLSGQQRKIVEFLCEYRGAAQVKEIARRCLISPQAAAAQLKELKEKGYVRSQSIGRDSFYELREILMRLTVEVKKNRGEPIRLFIDFLRLWHTKDELLLQLRSLPIDAIMERTYIDYALVAIDKEPDDPRIKACLADYNIFYNQHNWQSALKVAEELTVLSIKPIYCIYLIECYIKSSNYSGIENIIQTAKERSKNESNVISQESYAFICFYLEGKIMEGQSKYNEAIKAYKDADNISLHHKYKDSPYKILLNEFYYNFGDLMLSIKDYESSLTYFIESESNTKPDDDLLIIIKYKKLLLLAYTNRFPEAEKTIKEIITLSELHYIESEPTEIILTMLLTLCISCIEPQKRWRDHISFITRPKSDREPYEDMLINFNIVVQTTMNLPLEDAKKWVEIWIEEIKGMEMFEIKSRILTTAISYRETNDPRILLYLPIEERMLIEGSK